MTACPTCPICKKDVPPRPGNLAFPFCSSRCKMVDLGKWLNEDYRVPSEDESDPDESHPDPNDSPPEARPASEGDDEEK